MKKTIRLTESELKHMIMESVKRVLNENIGFKPEYSWCIALVNHRGDWVEDSTNSDDSAQAAFSTPDEAFRDGLRNLRAYDDDKYMLQIYYFTENGNGEYASGYFAINDHGNITDENGNPLR